MASTPGIESGRAWHSPSGAEEHGAGRWPVLVTDGEQRAALALVRSLGEVGHAVYVCCEHGRMLAGASRYARGRATVPSPLGDPAGFASAVGDLVRRWRVRLLLPVTDAALLSLLPRRDALGDAALPFPDVEVYRRISDKASVLEAAVRAGLATPKQRVLERPRRGPPPDLGDMTYPVVLKPARSVAAANGVHIKLAVSYASNLQELRDRLAALPAAAYPVLLQERIVGPGVGVFLLRWGGQTVAVFSHRRLREKPPSGGVSVLRESIPADPWLVARSEQLLDQFAWEGVAMVEYKVASATGTPYLMEVNGRFWGSLQLAVDAGVDFPVLLAAAAMGQPLPGPRPYRTGISLRWWWGDVDVLLMRLRRSGAAGSASDMRFGGRWQAVKDFLRSSRPGQREEILRWHDPLPFVRETGDWLKHALAPRGRSGHQADP